MEDHMKMLGIWAGLGAALGVGVALGLGLKGMATGAAVGVGAGVALGLFGGRHERDHAGMIPAYRNSALR